MASSDIRLPHLTVTQASALLDVLDALTAAVVREYGDAIAAHDDLRVSLRRRRRPPPAPAPAVLPRTPEPPPLRDGAHACVALADDEDLF